MRRRKYKRRGFSKKRRVKRKRRVFAGRGGIRL